MCALLNPPDRGSRVPLAAPVIAFMFAFVLALVATRTPAASAAGISLFRPITADPREYQTSWRVASFTEDWRYGTDITDSTSHGGFERGRKGIAWEVSGGDVFRWRPLRRIFGLAPPWRRYQLGVPAAIYADFDNTGSLLVTDFMFGATLDAQLSGPYDDDHGITSFDRPVWTARLNVYHRSSHLGDEYIALSRFGHNQDGHPAAGVLFDHPPVKRIDLSYEAVRLLLSREWAPGWWGRRGTLRAYAGGDAILAFPEDWHVGSLMPRNFRAPSGRVGLEVRSAGNEPNPHDGWVTRAINHVARDKIAESYWFGAFDLRLAKPYDFASADNPSGREEVWTPHLWTLSPYGREFDHYAGSWHAQVGVALLPRATPDATGRTVRPVGPEWLLTLAWYHGYSPNGQFLDQHLRYHPRAYVIPGISAHF